MQEIKDSGQRTEYATGFVRDMHEGKGRFDLLPWGAIWERAKHCEAGAEKYGERNIDKGAPQHSLIDSAQRHLAKYLMGHNDENHLRAALWNVAWALEQDTYKPEMQDIPARLALQEPTPEEAERIEEGESIKLAAKKIMRTEGKLACNNAECGLNKEGRCRSCQLVQEEGCEDWIPFKTEREVFCGAANK